MNTLMNMDPWGLFDTMFGFNGETFRNVRARAAGRFPPVNAYADENAVLLDMELPGKTANDVELTLDAQAIVIADKPAANENGKPGAPAWSRRFELPFRVDTEKANAKFTNGILRIKLPKAEAANVHRIAIAG